MVLDRFQIFFSNSGDLMIDIPLRSKRVFFSLSERSHTSNCL
ncbi:hypothetical protein LEP1GSC059_4156 [Leptospira noguchii serovar Panama str. CZ214]|uniref:Uncharacterized protein n=1 Tax=Leptospira noguchii serovar Panama str. CZ214 TaxID=1001595 RepID=T0FJH3_9LEPT|nr:hypothetical protein LEP1GSC059_4156 [Leptospira noguchii serovar Panama str. CZ214]